MNETPRAMTIASERVAVPDVLGLAPVAAAARGKIWPRPRRFDWARLMAVTANTAFLYAVVIAAIVPVIFLLAFSFNAAALGEPYRLGLEPWVSVFTRPENLSAIGTSFVLSLRTFIGGLVALLISWCLVRLDLPARRLIEIALWFAFFMPSVPIAMAWGLLLDTRHGLVNQWLAFVPFLPRLELSAHSIAGIMWVHLTMSTIPFLTLIFAPIIRQFDASYEEVARASGGSWLYAVRRVSLPLLAPAILAGLIASYIRVFESFEVEQLLGTQAGIDVFATRVFDLVRANIPAFPESMALSTFLLVIAVGLALVHARFNRARPAAPTIGPQGFRRGHPISPAARWTIAAVILAFVLVAVVLPVAVVLVCSFAKIFGFFHLPQPWTLSHWTTVLGDPRFVRALGNSVVAGVGIGVISVSLFFWLGWLLVRGNVKGRNFAAQLFWLPWALPGFVLGLSILWLTLRFDALAGFYGTVIPIIVVLAIKELPIGVHLFKVAISQLSPQLEEAAAIAGASRFYTIRRVTLPLLSSAVVSVFIIVFSAVMREVSAIVLLAAPGTETIALLLYEYAFIGKAESAAVIGVLYSAAALALAVLVSRRAPAQHLR
jgi:iron(III) transport system permease protein